MARWHELAPHEKEAARGVHASMVRYPTALRSAADVALSRAWPKPYTRRILTALADVGAVTYTPARAAFEDRQYAAVPGHDRWLT